MTDLSLPHMLGLAKLRSLAMAKTGLTTEAKAKLVLELQPGLTDLPHCGYLADVLDLILQVRNNINFILFQSQISLF